MYLKRLMAFLIVVLLLISAVSCNNTSKTNKPGDSGEPDETGNPLMPKDKKVVGWLLSDDPMDPEISGFIKKNPDFTIDNTKRNSGVFEDHSQDLPTLASAIASKTQPDLYWGWNSPAEAFYSNLFEPVQGYFEQDPEMKEEDFDPTVLKLLTFNDKLYFLTNEFSSFMFVWNRDIFEEAGLDPDNPPKTWDEYVEYGKKTTTYTPSGALKTIGVEQDNFSVEYWHAAYTGKYYINETGLEFDFNNDTMLETLEFAKSLSSIYGGNDKKGSGWWWFALNNIGMTQWGGAYIAGVNSSIGNVPLPDENSERHLLSRTHTFMGIPKKAKNPLGGWHAMKYFVTDGVLEREMASYQNNVDVYVPNYSVHKPTAKKVDEFFKSVLDDVRFENYQLRNELIASADVPDYSSPISPSISKYWGENLKKVYDDTLAPKDFLIQIQEYADAQIKEFKKQKEAEGWVFTDGKATPPKE